MRMFRLAFVFAAGAAMLAPLSQPASAADMGGGGSLKDTPYVVVPSWQGLYFGGHAGGAWGNTKGNDTFTYVGDPTVPLDFSTTGFIGGAQAGYNFQRGHFVFGVEADIGYLSISAGKSEKNLQPKGECWEDYGSGDSHHTYGDKRFCQTDAAYSISSNLYGDLTGRLGYATDRTLFYAKGGAAFLDAALKSNYAGQNCVTIGSSDCTGGQATHVGTSNFNYDHSDTLIGWTVGAGAEYALSPSWSVKAEYQHFDFGKMSSSYNGCVAMGHDDGKGGKFVCPPSSQGYANHYTSTLKGNTDVSITADAVKLGVNYHLGKE